MLADVSNAAVRMLLGPVCASCRTPLARPLEGPVCDACWRRVPAIAAPSCVRCGDELRGRASAAAALCERCRASPRRFTEARAAGRYEGVLRELVHALKYQHRRGLARPLAGLMARSAADLIAGADAAVPVPLHPWRALQRGFNQADDLARGLGLPVWRVLRRRRHGRPQAGLPADRRRDNVREAFGLAPGRRLRPSPANRVVVLVDDVMTTGETADACSAVLLAAGARAVRVVTAARAVAGLPPPPPPPPFPSTARRR